MILALTTAVVCGVLAHTSDLGKPRKKSINSTLDNHTFNSLVQNIQNGFISLGFLSTLHNLLFICCIICNQYDLFTLEQKFKTGSQHNSIEFLPPDSNTKFEMVYQKNLKAGNPKTT